GRNQRQVQLARERNQAAIDDLLLLDPLVLHLEEEIVLAENVPQTSGSVARLLGLLHLQCAGDFALQTAAESDEPFRVLREKVLVDARTIVEAFGVPGR